jgi:ADP-ribose pyrophosphatase YjhB (NUDIX family)
MEPSLDKAKKNKLFYFVVTGTIFRESDGRCLILQRSKKEIAHPGLWGVVGGKLEWGDLDPAKMTKMNFEIPNWDNAVEKLLARESKEESGLEVEDPRYLGSVALIRPDGVPVICAKFALKYKSGEVKLAPEFDDSAWVNDEEIKKYKIIGGIDEEVAGAIAAYSKS